MRDPIFYSFDRRRKKNLTRPMFDYKTDLKDEKEGQKLKWVRLKSTEGLFVSPRSWHPRRLFIRPLNSFISRYSVSFLRSNSFKYSGEGNLYSIYKTLINWTRVPNYYSNGTMSYFVKERREHNYISILVLDVG